MRNLLIVLAICLAIPNILLCSEIEECVRAKVAATILAKEHVGNKWKYRGCLGGGLLNIFGIGLVYSWANKKEVTIPNDISSIQELEDDVYAECFKNEYIKRVRNHRKKDAVYYSILGTVVLVSLFIYSKRDHHYGDEDN